ncbi:hypothetical protein [Vibrio mediterranei]|uniref:hypothetical protein n=1 Tax=Vibrio mediterranei TaxID=689 RepID=UPI0040695F3C
MANNKRKYSRPNIDRQLVVNSQSSIDACENYVNRTMSSLYALDVILFYIADGQVAETANDEVKRIFDSKHDVFDKDILKLTEKVEACEADEAKYTEEFSRNYKIYSPLCASYLKLIMKFERCINLIDSLWFAGELTSKNRTAQVMKLGRHLRNLSSQINNISRRAMEIARNEGKESEVTEAVKKIGAEEALTEAIIESKKTSAKAEKSAEEVAA